MTKTENRDPTFSDSSEIEKLRLQVATLTGDCERFAALLGKIRGYPYIPRGLIDLIERELRG